MVVWSFRDVLFCFCFQITRAFNSVVMRDALNKRVRGDMRATANSVASLGMRVLFIFFGPMVGHFIDDKGMSSSFNALGIFYVFCFFFLALPLIKQRREYVPIG